MEILLARSLDTPRPCVNAPILNPRAASFNPAAPSNQRAAESSMRGVEESNRRDDSAPWYKVNPALHASDELIARALRRPVTGAEVAATLKATASQSQRDQVPIFFLPQCTWDVPPRQPARRPQAPISRPSALRNRQPELATLQPQKHETPGAPQGFMSIGESSNSVPNQPLPQPTDAANGFAHAHIPSIECSLIALIEHPAIAPNPSIRGHRRNRTTLTQSFSRMHRRAGPEPSDADILPDDALHTSPADITPGTGVGAFDPWLTSPKGSQEGPRTIIPVTTPTLEMPLPRWRRSVRFQLPPVMIPDGPRRSPATSPLANRGYIGAPILKSRGPSPSASPQLRELSPGQLDGSRYGITLGGLGRGQDWAPSLGEGNGFRVRPIDHPDWGGWDWAMRRGWGDR